MIIVLNINFYQINFSYKCLTNNFSLPLLKVSALCVLLLIAGFCWADQQQQQQLGIPSALDAESINDLAKKPVKLDPKLRKALLKVLNRLEEEDRVTEVKLSEVESQQFQQQQQQFQQQQQQFEQQQQQLRQRQQQQRKQIRILDQQQIQILGQQQIQLQDQQKKQLQDQEQRLEQLQDQGVQRLQSQDLQQRQNPQPQLRFNVQEPTEQAQQERQNFTPSQTPTVALPSSTIAFTTPTEAIFQPSPTVALPTSSPKTAAVTLATSTSTGLLPTLLPTPNSLAATKSVSVVNDDVEKSSNNALRTPSPAASIAPTTDTGTVVDFFEAPLLTAFTVQQDSAGVPRRVIPIFTEPGQLERQKILALETRAESGDGGDRNTVEPDRNELEFLKSVELSKQQVPSREALQQRDSFALQQQLRFQQQLQQKAVLEEQQRRQQIVQQRQLQQQQQQQQLQQQQQQQQQLQLQQQQQQQQQQRQRQQQQQQLLQQQRTVVFQPQPQQQQQLQLKPVQVQPQQQPNRFVQQPRLQFSDSPLTLLPQFVQQQQQQTRVLRQPQSQSFGYGLSVPRLPGDLDVVYKVLALNHEGRNNNVIGPQPLLF